MSVPLDRPATADGLFLWVMHRFAEVFENHAVLKGGMALRLIDSPRLTNDIDYVFVPFQSKKEIREGVASVLREIEGAAVQVRMHSRFLRAEIRLDGAAIQIEINVAPQCPSIPMATGGFARALGQPSRIVRIMDLDCALAHKLAAWNERRLLRDLYDGHFLGSRLAARPDLQILDARLAAIDSRLPRMRSRKSMTRQQLAAELREAVAALTRDSLARELAGILPPEELSGLEHRIGATIRAIAERLDSPG